MQKRFEKKVVIVTGGNAGIGKEAALAFAREGARVTIAARRADEGEQTVVEIQAGGGEAIFIQTDVGRASDVERMVAETVRHFGKLDCAFNNAGIGGEAMKLTADHTEENWDLVMNTNLKGVWLCMKYQIPAMLKNRGGAIVNNSSVFGLAGSTLGHVPYAASKHGVIGLTKSAAFEYAKKGVRINAVCPGYTHTQTVDFALDYLGEEFTDSLLAGVPMGRLAQPREIAGAVLWLCSDESSFVTGQAFAPDGGWSTK
jgi:NAD(P)-dependent dehydrogenase (short-subunit alcohol dehydrogenase family)